MERRSIPWATTATVITTGMSALRARCPDVSQASGKTYARRSTTIRSATITGTAITITTIITTIIMTTTRTATTENEATAHREPGTLGRTAPRPPATTKGSRLYRREPYLLGRPDQKTGRVTYLPGSSPSSSPSSSGSLA